METSKLSWRQRPLVQLQQVRQQVRLFRMSQKEKKELKSAILKTDLYTGLPVTAGLEHVSCVPTALSSQLPLGAVCGLQVRFRTSWSARTKVINSLSLVFRLREENGSICPLFTDLATTAQEKGPLGKRALRPLSQTPFQNGLWGRQNHEDQQPTVLSVSLTPATKPWVDSEETSQRHQRHKVSMALHTETALHKVNLES